jgi:hypothetical protein
MDASRIIIIFNLEFLKDLLINNEKIKNTLDQIFKKYLNVTKSYNDGINLIVDLNFAEQKSKEISYFMFSFLSYVVGLDQIDSQCIIFNSKIELYNKFSNVQNLYIVNDQFRFDKKYLISDINQEYNILNQLAIFENVL